MRKRLSIVLVSCSLLLVLGHSMMPHQHYLAMTTAESITTERTLSFGELIRITLSQDLGSNHLEEYTLKGDLLTDVDESISDIIRITNNLDLRILATLQVQRIHVFDAPALKSAYFFTIGLRAPPPLPLS